MFFRILFFMCMPVLLQSAAALTHLYFADEFLNRFPKEEAPFLIGTSFPDIRYLGAIKREETHFDGVTISQILDEESDFRAGMFLHSFIDVKREEFVVKYGIYPLIEELGGPYKATLLKKIEDEILYAKIDAIKYIPFFNQILEEQLIVPLETNIKWHDHIQSYLADLPSNFSFPNIPKDINDAWNEAIPDLAQDEYFITYVDAMIAHILQLYDHQNLQLE